MIRPYLTSYFFQFTHSEAKSAVQELFDLYIPIKEVWETLIKDYISIIEKETEYLFYT